MRSTTSRRDIRSASPGAARPRRTTGARARQEPEAAMSPRSVASATGDQPPRSRAARVPAERTLDGRAGGTLDVGLRFGGHGCEEGTRLARAIRGDTTVQGGVTVLLAEQRLHCRNSVQDMIRFVNDLAAPSSGVRDRPLCRRGIDHAARCCPGARRRYTSERRQGNRPPNAPSRRDRRMHVRQQVRASCYAHAMHCAMRGGQNDPGS
jgi:hypothetical protein